MNDINKDIEILESECYYLEELGYLRENNHFIRFNQALENLIKGYRELEEKYKEELDDGLKMSEWIVLKQKQIEELEYKYDKALADLSIDAHRLNEAQYVIKLKDEDYRNLVDVIQKDSIPKSKVQEKIEELNKNELLCKMNFENIKFTIEVLQELMEDK